MVWLLIQNCFSIFEEKTTRNELSATKDNPCWRSSVLAVLVDCALHPSLVPHAQDKSVHDERFGSDISHIFFCLWVDVAFALAVHYAAITKSLASLNMRPVRRGESGWPLRFVSTTVSSMRCAFGTSTFSLAYQNTCPPMDISTFRRNL